MLTRYKQLERRLAKIEQFLDKRAQCAETPLSRVNLEAQQELPPEDLPLFQSAKAARDEGRFHSLEEHEVTEKFRRLQDVVGRRHGFGSYLEVIRQCLSSLPKPKPTAKGSADGFAIVKILNWGRDNNNHLQKLREAQQASQSNSSPDSSNHEHL